MASENETPKIPSFKPQAKEEEKKGGAVRFPTMAQEGGGGLKVRGLPGGATVIDRLKRLRKKDLAFIAAGLSVLMMAPVAEHFLMNSEQEGGILTQGFSTPGDNALFPDGRTVYESGTGGLSPGSLYGGGADVITPLNVRDPAALVMGPGSTQKSAAATIAPELPKDQPGGWKDALAQAATAGTKSAVSKGNKLPMPSVKMSGALRGMGALSGGVGGGSMSLAPLSASNVPNKARDSNSLARVSASPGYRGASRQSRESGGGMESLKAAADRQGDVFNKGRSAANSLDTAAREGIPTGGGQGSGEGGPGQGDGNKSPGGNTDNDKRNISVGESLEMMRQKMEMQKSIDLKWKKKEWNEFGRRQELEKMLIASGGKLFEKAFVEPVGNAIAEMFGSIMPKSAGGPAGYICLDASGNTIKEVPKGKVKDVGSNYISYVVDVGKDGTLQKIDCAKVIPYGGAKVGEGSSSGDPNDIDRQSPERQERGKNQGEIAQALATCRKEAAGGTARPFCVGMQRLADALPKVDAMEMKNAAARGELDLAFAKMDLGVVSLGEGGGPLTQANTLLGKDPEGKTGALVNGEAAQAKLEAARAAEQAGDAAGATQAVQEAEQAAKGAEKPIQTSGEQLTIVGQKAEACAQQDLSAEAYVKSAELRWGEGIGASQEAKKLIDEAGKLEGISAVDKPKLDANIATVTSDWKKWNERLVQVGGEAGKGGRVKGSLNGDADAILKNSGQAKTDMDAAAQAVRQGPKAAAEKLAATESWQSVSGAVQEVASENADLRKAVAEAANKQIPQALGSVGDVKEQVKTRSPAAKGAR